MVMAGVMLRAVTVSNSPGKNGLNTMRYGTRRKRGATMKIKVTFEFSISQVDIAEHHGVSIHQVRKAIFEHGIDAEVLEEIAMVEFEEQIRETIIDEFGNYVD